MCSPTPLANASILMHVMDFLDVDDSFSLLRTSDEVEQAAAVYAAMNFVQRLRSDAVDRGDGTLWLLRHHAAELTALPYLHQQNIVPRQLVSGDDAQPYADMLVAACAGARCVVVSGQGQSSSALCAWLGRLLHANVSMCCGAVEIGPTRFYFRHDDHVEPALFYAVTQSHLDCVRYLLAHRGCAVRTTRSSACPLTAAVRRGDLVMMDVLLAARADPNRVGEFGDSPLHVAAFHGNAEVITRLVAAGARIDSQNELGDLPLHLAASEGYGDCVEALLNCGAANFINQANSSGDAALHRAIREGHVDCVKLLLKAGADPNQRQRSTCSHVVKNDTPLILATRFATMEHLECVKVLVAAGADVDRANASGESVQVVALTRGRHDVLELLAAAKDGGATASCLVA